MIHKGLLLFCLAVTTAGATIAQAQGIDFDKTTFAVQQLAPNVYALTGSPGTDPGHPEGAGGRIGFLAGANSDSIRPLIPI